MSDPRACPFNKGVEKAPSCDCRTCGWNPVVELERKKDIRKKR